ncbi:hypothetical protein BHM03_00045359 [Ensete ventricosum]|nr:hypothetical protein BHM03_00045359 [Ensete ventricosum]
MRNITSFSRTGSTKDDSEHRGFSEEDWEQLNKLIGYKEGSNDYQLAAEEKDFIHLYLEIHMKHNASKLVGDDQKCSPYHDKLLSKVFHTDLYRPYRVVCTSPLGYRYVDCPLSGGIAKIDHRRSIEGERGKKKKKRKRRMRKEEKKKEYLASSSPVRRRCPRVARAPPTPSPAGRPRAVVALARDFSPTRGERSRRPGFNRDLHEPALTLSWNMDHHWLKLPMLAGLVCLDMPAVNIRYSGMSTT